MTFHSLYRLERRGLLDCPIVGRRGRRLVGRRPARARPDVDRRHGRDARRRRSSTASPRGSPTSQGDFADAETYERVADAIGEAPDAGLLPGDPAVPVRHGDQGAVRGRADRRRRASWSRSRSATTSSRRARSPRRSTSTSTSRSSTGSTTSSGRWAWSRSSTCGSRTRCSSRSGTATTVACVQITMAENFGVEDRGHFYDPVGALRDVVVNHLMQVVAAAAMEPPVARRPATLKDALVAVFRAIAEADPAHYVRGQYEGYRTIDGVAKDSTTETYAALRLEIDNWRWSGVPFFIRTGKRLPVTQTELRLVFKQPPRLGLRARWIAGRSRTSSWSGSTRPPASGCSSTPSARDIAGPSRSTSTWSSPQEGGEGPTPYEVLLARRDASATARASPGRTASRRPGGSCSRCSTRRRRSTRTRQGSWGPDGGRRARRGLRRLARAVDERSERRSAEARRSRKRRGRRARRCRRRSRRSPTTPSCPTATPARWSRPTARSTGSASRASTRRASSARCSTARPAPSGFGPFGINVPDARASTSRARTSS